MSRLVFATCMAPWASPTAAEVIDLSKAVVVSPADLTSHERKAVQVLVDELEERTLIRPEVVHEWPQSADSVIAVGPMDKLQSFAGPLAEDSGLREQPQGAEGFQIRIRKTPQGIPAIAVIGNDSRGVFHGCGRLLRELHLRRGSIRLPDSLDLSTAPRYPIRGHQLGFRPKTNSYDAWTAPMWEQYIRDLAVFGNNAIEIMPPRTDDAADSPHFPLPQIEMMAEMSRIADEYDMDVWIWYPAMDEDYTDPKTVEAALVEWGEVFKRLPRINAVFVPGGDPGHTQPRVLFNLLEKETEVLKRHHPKAQMWMSPQSFNGDSMEEFFRLMNEDQPNWLSGIVFGPQNRVSLPELRRRVPARYPIRHYPDITHTIRCQFAVPDWDSAFAFTEHREVINPRPRGYANIIRLWPEDYQGFITYSEGCNDDVNKVVWSELGWDPSTDVFETLRRYSRYFIGVDYTDTFAQGLLALERNWEGPLLANAGVEQTLLQFRQMEREASPQVLLNWRFQQALYRAYYDAYVKRRLAYETELEQQAMDTLRKAGSIGAEAAVALAEEILDRGALDPVATDLRARVFELAEALYQSIRMQLSVPRYQAIHWGRGGNLDLIDKPLNNRNWLLRKFEEIEDLDVEEDRLGKIEEILNWTNPGPGGFYDDLGSLAAQPRLVREKSPSEDPEFRESPWVGFEYQPERRISWCNHAETRYETPLKLHYTGLDPSARYRVRVVYAGEDFRPTIRLLADEVHEVHGYRLKENPIRPVEFDIPKEATADGELLLAWNQEPGRGGAGRGCQVGEVWLIRVAEAAE